MERRDFLHFCKNLAIRSGSVAFFSGLAASSGCAGRRYGHILANNDVDMVGSHEAGAAVWNPLVDQSVAKLLGRCDAGIVYPAAFEPNMIPGELPHRSAQDGSATVCFIALENKSAEELLDFKDQLYERIDSQINSSGNFRMVSRRMVDAALLDTRMRPDALFLPGNREVFAAALGRQGAPVDFLLYGKITSGTTERNSSTQRDYELTLEMVNIHSGDYVKESANIRKGYHNTRAGKWWNYGPFEQADG